MSSPRPFSMAMAAASMPGGSTAPPRHSPVLPDRSLSPAVGSGITVVKQGVEASDDVGQELVDGEALKSPASSKKKRLKDASRNSQEPSQLTGSKRPLSTASGSLRVSKAAKAINAKVEITQLKENSKTGDRKAATIKCRSPGINMMARNKAQAHARSPSVVPSGTPKSPSLQHLSPAAAHVQNKSKLRRKGSWIRSQCRKRSKKVQAAVNFVPSVIISNLRLKKQRFLLYLES